MKKSPFFVNEVYGLGYWLKDYGYYPKSWPLFTYMDHGTTLSDTIPPHERENDAPVIFKFSPRLVAEFAKVSKKPVYGLINPTIYCRSKKKISKDENASGSLFFPAHTTEMIDDNTSWDSFIQNLDNIPAQYKPIDICLHPTDVKKGLDKIFRDKGYKVYTAGDAFSYEFPEKMYNILRRYKFSISNIVGSYVFYSIEMGIPFSLYGSEPKFNNIGDNNIERGEYTSYKRQSAYQKAVKLFTGFHTEISQEQAAFINTELGKYHSISRVKASILLYRSLIQYLITHPAYLLPPRLTSILVKMKRKLKAGFRLANGIRLLTGLFVKNWLSKKKDEEYLLYKKGFIGLSELLQLKFRNRNTATLLGKKIQVTDSFWYLHSLKEIFIEEVYRFAPETETPLILDCGSNIGLSIVYFKRLYPKAKVIGFEPDQDIFNQLANNMKAFGYDDVELKNKAIWTEETTLNFQANGSLGGKIDNSGSTGQLTKKVSTERLREYLRQPVDFLKMDIEGPEVEVLRDCGDDLKTVKCLFVEYHSDPSNEQKLDTLLSILKKAGFRVYIKEAWNNLPLPFMRKDYSPFYDLQLNIFAYRVNP